VTPLGGGALLVSVPVPESESETKARLTAAELAVAKFAMRGMANQAIAAARGCSLRTVVNQLTAVYSKLRISGRRELRARLNGIE